MILVWTGLAIAALALIAVLASVGPLRRFLKLREEVRTRLQDLATVVAPAQAETKAMLDEAQHVFHELGTRMSGFARRGIAKLSIRGMGYDPSSASSGLIGFSNALPVYGIERLRWRAQVERALKIQNAQADARMKRSRLDPLLVVLALVALAFAAWMYTANRNLHHALQVDARRRGASRASETRRRTVDGRSARTIGGGPQWPIGERARAGRHQRAIGPDPEGEGRGGPVRGEDEGAACLLGECQKDRGGSVEGARRRVGRSHDCEG